MRNGLTRRDVVFGGLAVAASAMLSCGQGEGVRNGPGLPTNPERLQYPKGLELLGELPAGPGDAYVLFYMPTHFEGRSDDNFIAGAAELVYPHHGEHYWHVNVMYPMVRRFSNGAKQHEWAFADCSPPYCGVDMSLDQAMEKFRGYRARVMHVQLDPHDLLKARDAFEHEFQGRMYSLTGRQRTNCADAVYVMGVASGLIRPGQIHKYTRDQLSGISDVEAFLERYGYGSVDEIMLRSDIIFPNELIEPLLGVPDANKGEIMFPLY